ncbi:MAG: hydroxyisourate hydrolase [Proteobacteria bacterium]|nr:hydroxyisourate hydrolase [Pseudomonadota bacterium]
MNDQGLSRPARRQFALSGLALGAAALAPRAALAQASATAPAPGAAPATGPIVQAGASPRLTVHAIDTYFGSAAAGLRIDFSKREGDGWKLVRSVVTNANGRSEEPLLVGDSYQPGEYELVLHAQEYFERRKANLPTPPFLSTVPVRIRIADVSKRFHLPIQLGPWSYSYSRGS